MHDTRKNNHLIAEKSPYLLQHKDNPVDWWPWSEESLAHAQKEDKPIFLSIGYSTCHWCHVMAHESFENEAIAEHLNRAFVSIKVDREERPDIDQIYMTATQAMTGSGGWPMSLFLLPDGRPFFAGSYFPLQARYGHPGFGDILATIEKIWREDRGKLIESAGRITNYLQQLATGTQAASVNPDLPAKGLAALSSLYDRQYAGFGQGNKFPQPVYLEFLLGYYHRYGDQEALTMVVESLQAMCAGGMYDHVGGGFHRYAVDRQWRVPHFEKMLYDQAQLAAILLDAALVTSNRRFAEVARETLDYTLRDMRRDGGFFSAEDADSENPYAPGEHGEGAFFLWTEEEIDRILANTDAAIFKAAYGVQKNGNALSDPAGEFTGRNILYRRTGNGELAGIYGKSEEEIDDILRTCRIALLRQRDRRTHPHLDDKVITAWNGLMISALAKGGRILEDERYGQAAAEAADFLLERLVIDGRLKRRWRDGEARFDATLEDYAFLVQGLLDLYALDHEPKRLQQAIDLTHRQIGDFADPEGGFFDTSKETALIARMKGLYDGAEPSGNSVTAMNLLRLSQLTGDESWRQMAEKTILAAAAILDQQPAALPLMLAAHLKNLGPQRLVVIAGNPANEGTKRMLRAVNSRYLPDTTVLLADGGENQKFLAGLLPFIGEVHNKEGRAMAMVCEGMACRLQTDDPAEFVATLGKY